MVSFQTGNFIKTRKRDSNSGVFFVNIAKFSRAGILKNIYKRLLLCFNSFSERTIAEATSEGVLGPCRTSMMNHFAKILQTYFTVQKQSLRGVLIKNVLKNFAKFTGKHLCQSLFLNKVAGLRSTTLLKKKLWHRCFPVNFAKFL